MCECGLARVGSYDPSQCRPCWLALNRADYQESWGLPVTGHRPVRPLPSAEAVRIMAASSPTGARCCGGRVDYSS